MDVIPRSSLGILLTVVRDNIIYIIHSVENCVIDPIYEDIATP